MSNTTKMLAALGVVAGLGVASLPIVGVSALDPVSDTVNVKTTISESISMTVEGNDDSNAPYDETENPTGAKHQVLLSLDGESDGIITNSSNGFGKATINVATNVFYGYNVTLTGGDLVGETSNTNKIAALGSAVETFPTSGTSAWGYKIGATTDSSKTAPTVDEDNVQLLADWNGPSVTAAQIINSKKATTNSGHDYDLDFQVYADASQGADVYNSVVTLTATANLAPNPGA